MSSRRIPREELMASGRSSKDAAIVSIGMRAGLDGNRAGTFPSFRTSTCAVLMRCFHHGQVVGWTWCRARHDGDPYQGFNGEIRLHIQSCACILSPSIRVLSFPNIDRSSGCRRDMERGRFPKRGEAKARSSTEAPAKFPTIPYPSRA